MITEGNEQKAINEAIGSLEVLNEATAELDQYKDSVGSLRLLAVIMYATFALLFLLRALITRANWRLNLFRYGMIPSWLHWLNCFFVSFRDYRTKRPQEDSVWKSV